MEVKEIIPNLNKPVRYKNSTSYTLTGATVRRRPDGNIYYTAELLDNKNGNSVCIVKLEDVENGS